MIQRSSHSANRFPDLLSRSKRQNLLTIYFAPERYPTAVLLAKVFNVHTEKLRVYRVDSNLDQVLIDQLDIPVGM